MQTHACQSNTRPLLACIYHASNIIAQLLYLLQVVISDVPGCGGWKYAAEHSIATVAYPASSRTVVNGKQTGVSTEELMLGLKDHHQIDYVLLAGYLKVSSQLMFPNLPENPTVHRTGIKQGGAEM